MHDTFEATVTRIPTSTTARAFREPSAECPKGQAYAVPFSLVHGASARARRLREGDRLRLTVDTSDPDRIIHAEKIAAISKVAPKYVTV